MRFSPMPVVLMSDVAGAIFASIALAAVKIPKLEKTEQKEQHFTAEIKEGLQVFQEDKKLFYIVIAEALCMFFYAPLSSFYPLMTSDYFKLSAMYGSAVGAILRGRDDGVFPVIFQCSESKPKNQSFFHRFVYNGSCVADLRDDTAYVCRLVFLCGKLYRFGGFRQCTYNSADCLYAGDHLPGQDGAGIFGSHVNFICYNAFWIAVQQSHSRKSRCKCLVLRFRAVHDSAYCRRFHTVCGRMQERETVMI